MVEEHSRERSGKRGNNISPTVASWKPPHGALQAMK
jgi:hypothetical protein